MERLGEDSFYDYPHRINTLPDVRFIPVDIPLFPPPPESAFADRGGGESGATFDPIPMPFDVTVGDTGATRDVDLVAGVLNNVLPSNMFTTLSVSETGSWYVILTGTFVNAKLSGASLSISATAPAVADVTENVPPTSAAALIAVIVDTAVFQIRRGNGQMLPVRAFTTEPTPPADPGELPYITWWTYSMSFG